MTDLRVKAKQMDVGRQRDDTWADLRASRDGSPIVCPWYQAIVLEGRAFQAGNDPGTELTLMTSYADTSKTLFVDIPDGTAAIPLKVTASFVAAGAALMELYAFVSLTLNGIGGTETLLTPTNLRGDSPLTSGAVAAHTASSATDTVTGTEIFLSSQGPLTLDADAIEISPVLIDWSVGRHVVSPVCLDAASINVTIFAPTSGTGRSDIMWGEFPETAFK